MQSTIHSIEELIPHILYEDEDLLVLHKIAGIAVQSKDVFQKDLNTLLLNYLPTHYLGIVQRLDQPVEGILVFGKTKKATAKLHDQMKQKDIVKRYQAVVLPAKNAPELFPGEEEEHELRDFLLKAPGQNHSSVVDANVPGAKESYLAYKTIATLETPQGKISLLSIHLGTGRHHQIRVQLSHVGLPILGDFKYGVKSENGLGLCATSLEFTHPRTGKLLHFEKEPSGSCFAPFYA